MSRICTRCNFAAEDSAVFCPACGTVFDADGSKEPAPDAAPSAPLPTDLRYARPNNVNENRRYAQPLQDTSHSEQLYHGGSQTVAPAAAKPKKRLPYILIGFGAAALIFTVALILILSSGRGIDGTYTWTSGTDGNTGKMVIYKDGSALFMPDSGGSLTLTFDTDRETVSYKDVSGKVHSGVYIVSGDDLSVIVDGDTDTFKKQ